MKKLIAFLLLGTLSLNLAACSSAPKADSVKWEENSGGACATLTGEFDGDKDTKDDTVLIVAGKSSVSMMLAKGNQAVQDDTYDVIMRVGSKKYKMSASQDSKLSYAITFDRSDSNTIIDALKNNDELSFKFTSPNSNLEYAFSFSTSGFNSYYKW